MKVSNVVTVRSIWIVLLTGMLLSVATVLIPVWLIQPFREQTPLAVTVSFFLRRYAKVLCVGTAVIVVVSLMILWKRTNYLGKSISALCLAIVLLSDWFSFQNHFEWMFNPLANTSYSRVHDATFVDDDDLVLAIEINGDAVAYPVRLLAYHHLVQDNVGGIPIVATY